MDEPTRKTIAAQIRAIADDLDRRCSTSETLLITLEQILDIHRQLTELADGVENPTR